MGGTVRGSQREGLQGAEKTEKEERIQEANGNKREAERHGEQEKKNEEVTLELGRVVAHSRPGAWPRLQTLLAWKSATRSTGLSGPPSCPNGQDSAPWSLLP